jgi:hypothetical protein
MRASLTDQAIEFLVERRWAMLPSCGTQKKPCVGWKSFQEQLPTVDELREWDRRFRPERWGLVTGRLAGIVVADFDGELGIDLMRTWDLNPHIRTGSGGFHCYLQHPGWRVPTLNAKSSKASWLWPGLDIRGDGGFAVLLGRNSNGPYVQLRDLVPEPFDTLPAEVRAFLRERSEQENATPNPAPSVCAQSQRNAGGKRVAAELLIRKALETASRGSRNDAGFLLACQLRDNGYSNSEALGAMQDYRSRVSSTNTKGKREAYTEHEMKASLEQAYSAPAREPWERRKANSDSESKPPSRRKPAPGGSPISENEERAHGGSADHPGILDIYVGHVGEPLVGHTGEPLSRKQYSRIPREVSSDRRLKHRDVRVYAALSTFCRQGSVAQAGKRLLAKLARCAERLVIDSLKNLEATGHIQKCPVCRGARGRYVLLSPVFGQKQSAGVREVAMGPSGPRLVSSPRKKDCA